MTKQEIRKKYLNLRLALSDEECASKSQLICNNFFLSIDLSKIKILHTFLPIFSKKEVNSWLIIHRLQKEFPEIRISIPKIENSHLANFFYEGEKQLEKNEWGILEPKYGEATPTKKIDLVIVPLLAYDLKGNRVGYGKGFYDQFLKQCRPDCLKVGLSFFENEVSCLSSESHDIKLDLVANPLDVIHIK